jgi:N-acetylmuramic acid 6-phosphate (MurNAc-6-P) etherase
MKNNGKTEFKLKQKASKIISELSGFTFDEAKKILKQALKELKMVKEMRYEREK